ADRAEGRVARIWAAQPVREPGDVAALLVDAEQHAGAGPVQLRGQRAQLVALDDVVAEEDVPGEPVGEKVEGPSGRDLPAERPEQRAERQPAQSRINRHSGFPLAISTIVRTLCRLVHRSSGWIHRRLLVLAGTAI